MRRWRRVHDVLQKRRHAFEWRVDALFDRRLQCRQWRLVVFFGQLFENLSRGHFGSRACLCLSRACLCLATAAKGAARIVEEIWSNLRKEIDFRREARNIKRFAEAFADWPTIHIPGVVDDLMSESVVVQERSGGRRIEDPELRPDGPRLAETPVRPTATFSQQSERRQRLLAGRPQDQCYRRGRMMEPRLHPQCVASAAGRRRCLIQIKPDLNSKLALARARH